jgi:CRP-like cAMP-binding protein
MEQLPGFRTLPPAERERVRAAVRTIEAPKGAVLFSEGQPSTDVWAVRDGLVHIVKSGPGGREIVLEVITSGELFGAVVALEDRPYPAAAIAAEASTVWRVPSALVREICQRHPTLRSAILALVTTRLRSAHERLQSVALEPVEQRLARMLLALVPKIGQRREGVTILPVTRQELADMVGTTVETTIRITSKWQRGGVVRSARNELTIADPAALRILAEGEDG